MAGISKAERERRAAAAGGQKGPIPDDGDAGDAQPEGGEPGATDAETGGDGQPEVGAQTGDTGATDPAMTGSVQSNVPELVSMVRDDGRMPAKADVHPDEVENYQRGGWRVA